MINRLNNIDVLRNFAQILLLQPIIFKMFGPFLTW